MFDDIEDAIKYLETHGRVIGAKARAGDELCGDIVVWYGLFYRAQGDPMARVVVMTKLEEYVKRENQQSEATP